MCIAVYKPMGEMFPNKKTLQRCFNHNPDGAGFMVATGDKVIIHKGYMGFRSFWKALRACREQYGEEHAYVMHFRISTQGGVRADGCHPFPLSSKMDDMRKLDTECEIGIAHNGIIDLCSGGWGKTKVDYSDTMEFITEYLSLIIRDKKYYKDSATLELISKLCGSRLAILDKRGHCELIGRGWERADGVWYSNDSYQDRTHVPVTSVYAGWNDWSDEDASYLEFKSAENEEDTWRAYFDWYYNEDGGYYEFSPGECPIMYTGDASYCELCINCTECYK